MKRLFIACVMLALAAPAAADTLYVAGPPGTAPGHPLRLGVDHRASQVGDILQVTFNFSVNATTAGSASNSGSASTSAVPGTGLLGITPLSVGASLSGSKSSASSKGTSQVNSIASVMMATVTNVLPSGALAIAGDQKLMINGQLQTLHITGVVRPEDIDSTDSVLSTRVAAVDAKFDGAVPDNKRGLFKKLVDFLFL